MKAVLFALNACPLASLGPYGNEWIATPNLDRLASEGIVFDNHISACPDPAAARREWIDRLTRMKSAGLRTVLVRANRETTDAPAEFYAAWAELFDARPDPADESPLDALLRSLPTILDNLNESQDWFLWIDFDRLTPPWVVKPEVFEVYVEDLDDDGPADYDEEPVRPWIDPPTGWFDTNDLASWELLHRTVAAVVTVFDAELGQLIGMLRERGLDRTATWLLTADRGWPLGEHGVLGPFRPWLHQELVQTPLIVRLPAGADAGLRIPAITQSVDLVAAVAEWFGDERAGRNLTPLIRGDVESIRDHAITRLATATAEELSIRTPGWAYLLPIRVDPDDDPREPLLFAQPDDPWEVNDCLSREGEVAASLTEKLTSPPG